MGSLQQKPSRLGGLQQKTEQAKQYLDERGINRASVECQHKYDRKRHQPPPRFDVSPSGKPVKIPGADE